MDLCGAMLSIACCNKLVNHLLLGSLLWQRGFVKPVQRVHSFHVIIRDHGLEVVFARFPLPVCDEAGGCVMSNSPAPAEKLGRIFQSSDLFINNKVGFLHGIFGIERVVENPQALVLYRGVRILIQLIKCLHIPLCGGRDPIVYRLHCIYSRFCRFPSVKYYT